jgi:hypothetical protein
VQKHYQKFANFYVQGINTHENNRGEIFKPQKQSTCLSACLSACLLARLPACPPARLPACPPAALMIV